MKKMSDKKQRFAIRKLGIGAVSVLIGSLFYLNSLDGVHADSVSAYSTQGRQTDNSNDISNKVVVLSNSVNREAEANNTVVDSSASSGTATVNSAANTTVAESNVSSATVAESNASSGSTTDQTKYSDLSFWTDKFEDRDGSVYLNAIDTLPSGWTIKVPKTGKNDIADPEPDKFYAFANIKKNDDTYFVVSQDLVNGQTYVSVYNKDKIEQNVDAIDASGVLEKLNTTFTLSADGRKLSVKTSDGNIQLTYYYLSQGQLPAPAKSISMTIPRIADQIISFKNKLTGESVFPTIARKLMTGTIYTTYPFPKEGYTVKVPKNASGVLNDSKWGGAGFVSHITTTTSQGVNVDYSVEITDDDGLANIYGVATRNGVSKDLVLSSDRTKTVAENVKPGDFATFVVPAFDDVNSSTLSLGNGWTRQTGNITYLYVPDSQRAIINYIDEDNNTVLDTVSVNGYSDQSINYDIKPKIEEYEEKGYKFISTDYPANPVFDHDDAKNQVFNVYFKAKHSLTENFVDENGKELVASETKGTDYTKGNDYDVTEDAKVIDGYYLKEIPTNAKGTFDTGNVTVDFVYKPVGKIIPVDESGKEISGAKTPSYKNDPNDPTKVTENEPVPEVTGYTPDVKTVTPTNPGEDTKVVYRQNVKDVTEKTSQTVTFEGAGAKTPAANVQNDYEFTGKYNEVTQKTTWTEAKNISVKNISKLPQTGDSENNLLVVLGAAMTVGLMGLVGVKRRKKDE